MKWIFSVSLLLEFLFLPIFSQGKYPFCGCFRHHYTIDWETRCISFITDVVSTNRFSSTYFIKIIIINTLTFIDTLMKLVMNVWKKKMKIINDSDVDITEDADDRLMENYRIHSISMIQSQMIKNMFSIQTELLYSNVKSIFNQPLFTGSSAIRHVIQMPNGATTHWEFLLSIIHFKVFYFKFSSPKWRNNKVVMQMICFDSRRTTARLVQNANER